MGLVKLALSNIYGVIVFALFIMVLGSLAIVSIPVDILPAFKVPAVQVLTFYNGMPTRSVERTLTDRIERWVNQSPGAANVESRSVTGVSVVRVYFREDVDPNTAITMSSSLTDAARPYLPTNTLPPVVLPFDPTGTLPLGILTVSNPKMAEQEVKDLARVEVRNRLGAVPGVVAPVVVGGKDRRVMIYLRPKDLESRRLSAVDVVNALDRGNMMVSPGTAYFGENQVSLDTNMMVRTVDDFNDMPITFEPGRRVLLRDIGYAEDDAVIQKSRVRVNGKQQVFVPIYRQAGSSSLAVADGVKAVHPADGVGTPRREQTGIRHRPVGVRPQGDREPHPRGHHRGHPGLDHDPDLPGRLEDDADRVDVAAAGDPGRGHRAEDDGTDDQRDDPRRAVPRDRPAGR